MPCDSHAYMAGAPCRVGGTLAASGRVAMGSVGPACSVAAPKVLHCKAMSSVMWTNSVSSYQLAATNDLGIRGSCSPFGPTLKRMSSALHISPASCCWVIENEYLWSEGDVHENSQPAAGPTISGACYCFSSTPRGDHMLGSSAHHT